MPGRHPWATLLCHRTGPGPHYQHCRMGPRVKRRDTSGCAGKDARARPTQTSRPAAGVTLVHTFWPVGPGNSECQPGRRRARPSSGTSHWNATYSRPVPRTSSWRNCRVPARPGLNWSSAAGLNIFRDGWSRRCSASQKSSSPRKCAELSKAERGRRRRRERFQFRSPARWDLKRLKSLREVLP